MAPPSESETSGACPWFDRARCEPAFGSEAPEYRRLPSDWFALLTGGEQTVDGHPLDTSVFASSVGKWLDWCSRRASEGAAALAFAKLPAERQQELLATTEAAPQPAKRPKGKRKK